MKNIFSLILSVIAINGYAQINPTDSVLKNATLKEVLINGGEKDKSTEAFNFYRSSKISSTEDILSRIEGVNLIKRGPFGMEPTLRSYSAGQLNITINGMRMYGACTDKMDPVSSYVEPGNLSTLQVNQGAGQSLMNSTIGGSINFELKEAQINCHKPVLLNAHSQYSSINNALNTGFNLNLSGAKVATRISATYRNAQNYYGGNHTLVKYSSYEKLNTSLGIAAQLNANNTLLADVITDQGLNIGYPALPMDVSSAKAFITSITHRKVFKSNKASFIETKLYYNTITHLMDDTKRPETIIHMDMPGWSNTLGFYSKLQLVKNKHQLQARLDGHQAYTKADMTMYHNTGNMYMQTLPGNDLNNIGGAIQYQYLLTKKYSLGSSTRIDYYKQIATSKDGILQWEGFGAKVDEPLSNWLNNSSVFFTRKAQKIQTQIIAAYGSRLPSSNERLGLYLFNRADGYDYLGNFLLKPEQAWQLDIKNSFELKKVSLSSTIFYHHITNYIYSHIINGYSAMTIGARGVKTYQNIAYANLMGFEGGIKVKLKNKLNYQGNIRYTYGVLPNSVAMQQVPPLKLLNTIRYQTDSFQVQLEYQFASNQHRINPLFGEVKTPYWNTLSVRAAYLKHLKIGYIQFHAAIENILDTYYREHLDWGNIPQPGRNFILGVNYYLN